MAMRPGRGWTACGTTKPSTFFVLACAAYVGKRDSPWPFNPSASAPTNARATLVALSALVRQRVSVRTTSASASASVSVGMAPRGSRAPVKLGHHVLAVTERLRGREPSVRSAHDHVDQRVAGLRDGHVAAQDAGHVDVDVLAHGADRLRIAG